jgi:hypothetical protein
MPPRSTVKALAVSLSLACDVPFTICSGILMRVSAGCATRRVSKHDLKPHEGKSILMFGSKGGFVLCHLPVCFLGLKVATHVATGHATNNGGQGVQRCVAARVLQASTYALMIDAEQVQNHQEFAADDIQRWMCSGGQ